MSIDLSGLKIKRIGTLVVDVSADDNASSLLPASAYDEYDSLVIMGPTIAAQGTLSLVGLRDEELDETADGSFVPVHPAVAIAQNLSVKITDGLPYPGVRVISDGAETVNLSMPVFGIRKTITHPR